MHHVNSEEEWRVIPSAPDYAVSNLGRVKRVVKNIRPLTGRPLRVQLSTHGYPQVALFIFGKTVQWRVHRAVCEAFNGLAPSPTHHAAHRDGNRLNSSPSNVYWATPQENTLDTVRHGTQARGEKISKLTPADIDEIRKAPKQYGNFTALAKKFGVHRNTILFIRKRQTWAHI